MCIRDRCLVLVGNIALWIWALIALSLGYNLFVPLFLPTVAVVAAVHWAFCDILDHRLGAMGRAGSMLLVGAGMLIQGFLWLPWWESAMRAIFV